MALRPLIGRICHVYIDDIVIWSQTVEEHTKNIRTVLSALATASLYCNAKKTHLFCWEIDFLGHHISARGIEAHHKKVSRILDWPVPQSASDVRAFLGLVRYIANFLPMLADHTAVLMPLTEKHCDRKFPAWTDPHQFAFDEIKCLVISRDCLTVIDHDLLDKNNIYVTTDASDNRSGAMLSFGPTWETARPVAFDSMTFKAAELNYPVHEKELLAIIRALRRWRTDLLGNHFIIYTDHRTLENFMTQKDLSRQQCRWSEFMSQFDFEIRYIDGHKNTVADALSRTKFIDTTPPTKRGSPVDVIAALISIPPKQERIANLGATRLTLTSNPSFAIKIKAGYQSDPWCIKMAAAAEGMSNFKSDNGFWWMNDRLVIPNVPAIRTQIFRWAHDLLGHFGIDKSYAALRDSFFWPGMFRSLARYYVPGCSDCQRFKAARQKPSGPLHPLPVPDHRGASIAMDFVGPLPEDQGFNCILTITDRLGSEILLIPTRTDATAKEIAILFFDHWYCEHGLPTDIICDRDTKFTSHFWRMLHNLTGVDVKMSSAFHPETDGASERTNRTLSQALRFHVERNQKGWVKALPRVRFHMMNTVNASTGFSGFHLKMGRSPRLVPPISTEPFSTADLDTKEAILMLKQLEMDVMKAQDNLLAAKVTQATAANSHRRFRPVFGVGDRVWLSTQNRRREYKAKGEKRVAKLMPRFDGPYKIAAAHPEFSTYTLDLPNSTIFPTFHVSQLLPYHESDSSLFPGWTKEWPKPIIVDGIEEFPVDAIIDERRRGRGMQYLVCFKDQPPSEDRWLSGSLLQQNEALDVWLRQRE